MPDLRSLLRWDVICRVVDHYGDAGVCLRLARRLAASPGSQIRLVADRPQVVLDLIQPPPPGDAVSGWRDRSGVLICGWDATPRRVDVLLETFGSDMPPALLEDMSARHAAGQVTPVWMDLQHLSAEAWVEGCHGLPSPRPGGLTRWFLFPGFTGETAGLPGPQTPAPMLPDALAALLTGLEAKDTAASPAGVREDLPSSERPLLASAFCYRESPLPALLDAMQKGPRDVRMAIPAGMPGDLGGRPLGSRPGSAWHHGHLTLVRIPFVDQDLYDGILATCDLNLVRGEDSFVRAQWAAKPLLWAAYRQPGDAHLDKVAAWLERCTIPPAWAALHGWYNGGMGSTAEPPVGLWHAAVGDFESARIWAGDWQARLLALPRVEETLTDFALRHASPLQ